MIIESRFNGPPGTGNGGYSAGTFVVESGLAGAGGAGTPVEVTLRRPPPLDVPLALRSGDEAVQVTDPDGALIAELRPTTLDADEVVEPISFDEAVEASKGYPGFTIHPFPTCFVCGPQREPGDGLRLFPGRLPGSRTAAPFVVPADPSPRLIWASLDCPGGWAVPLEGRPYVLGRLAADLHALPEAGERCVVMGAMTGEDGRKAFTRSTLYGSDGRLLAAARATWVALA
jgi:hypothetical protein